MAIKLSSCTPGLRPAWLGDLLASMFVGWGLIFSYRWLAAIPSAPELVGYLIPLMVYRFSTSWNRTPFVWSRAVTISLAMGSVFWAVHALAGPELLWLKRLTGFVAPLIVSCLGRQGPHVALSSVAGESLERGDTHEREGGVDVGGNHD